MTTRCFGKPFDSWSKNIASALPFSTTASARQIQKVFLKVEKAPRSNPSNCARFSRFDKGRRKKFGHSWD